MSPSLTLKQAPTPVSTILTEDERIRVDAAGEGLYCALHRDSLDEVLRDLKDHRATAVLMSVTRCGPRDAGRIAHMVREFPRVPAVALLTGLSPATPQTVLSLGRSGVRTLVDVRQPVGWHTLRNVLVADLVRDIERRVLGQLSLDLAGAPNDCRQFFEALFTCPPGLSTIRGLAKILNVVPSTLMSRFFRSRLPAPKRFLAMARLVRAAYLFENPGLSVANVANHLDYSSPQSFGRHVRGLIRLTGLEFRQRYDGARMLDHFRDEMVIPFLPTLRVFTPLTTMPSWSPLKERATIAQEAEQLLLLQTNSDPRTSDTT